MAKIAVVIPSFNCAEFIVQAIDSVLGQTWRDYEVLVIDDGSTDNTREVLSKFDSDPRVRVVTQANRGLPGARNRGVQESNSDFVAFLDADDALVPEALEKMLHEVERTGADWCLVDILKSKPNGTEVQKTELSAGDPFYSILKDDFIRRGMFFRRSALVSVGMYDETMKYREDWDLNIRMFAALRPFCYIPEPLYIYTWREGSITTSKRARVLHYTEQLLKKNHKAFADAGDAEAAKLYSQNMWTLGRFYFYEVHEYRRALWCVFQSLIYDFKPSRLLHPFVHNAGRVVRKSA